MKKYRWLPATFIAGVAYRIWLTFLVPQPFVYDQYQYLGFIRGILTKGFHADSYRLYGYPLIMAPVFFLFGEGNPIVWRVMQAGMDTLTGFLIFLIARRIFKNPIPAWTAYLLYLANPYTSAYTGVLLSEVAATFLLTLLFYLLVVFFEKTTLKVLLACGVLLGFIPQVRQSFLLFTIPLLLYLMYKQVRSSQHLRQRIVGVLLLAAVYILPFSYTIVSNKINFNQFALLSVDNVFVRELYTSQFIKRGLPSGDDNLWVWPQEAISAWNEYSMPKNEKERSVMTQKYLRLALRQIQKDPAKFITWRVQKLWYVWEKHYLFPYVLESKDPRVNSLVYWSNNLLLVLTLVGIITFIRSHEMVNRKEGSLFVKLSIFFICYISLVHIFSTAEERFSLPAYPLLFLFSGFEVWYLAKYLIKKATSAKYAK